MKETLTQSNGRHLSQSGAAQLNRAGGTSQLHIQAESLPQIGMIAIPAKNPGRSHMKMDALS
jgi:hypothetical protein